MSDELLNEQLTDPQSVPSIAIGIVSRNEARDLDACLATVPWATEIYVLDMQSTDDTRAVAEKYGATIIPVREVPVAEQVRDAYLTLFESDWMLQLDCDERVDPQFREKIIEVLQTDDVSDVAAFVLPFRLYACGSPIDHGMGRNGSVRFFRRGKVRYSDAQGAHRNPILAGELRDLTGRVPPVHHYAITSVDQYLEKCIRYAKTESLEISADQLDPFVFWRMFYKFTVIDEGWKDGVTGMLFTSILAFSRALPHAYAWERLGHPSVPLKRRGQAVATGVDVRKAFNDQVDEPLLDHALRNAGTAPVGDIIGLARESLRAKPSLLLHPTSAKAAIKFTGTRLVKRGKSLLGR